MTVAVSFQCWCIVGSNTEEMADVGPSAQSVGREFVRQYYTMLNERPDCLHRFVLFCIMHNVLMLFIMVYVLLGDLRRTVTHQVHHRFSIDINTMYAHTQSDSVEGQSFSSMIALFCFRFFSHNSSYVHGGVEKPGEEQLPVKGQAVSAISHCRCRTTSTVCTQVLL